MTSVLNTPPVLGNASASAALGVGAGVGLSGRDPDTAEVPSPPPPTAAGNANPDFTQTQNISDKITGILTVSAGGRRLKKPREAGKPPYSYIALICMAIANAEDNQATLRQICDFISSQFPYFRNKEDKWRGNVRHNLTLNPCFVKFPRRPGDKGHPWGLKTEYEDMFDGGSLQRRRYRYKEGSEKWVKDQAARKADKNTRTKKTGKKSAVPCNAEVVKQEDGTSVVVPVTAQTQTDSATGGSTEATRPQTPKTQPCDVTELVVSNTVAIRRHPAGHVTLKDTAASCSFPQNSHLPHVTMTTPPSNSQPTITAPHTRAKQLMMIQPQSPTGSDQPITTQPVHSPIHSSSSQPIMIQPHNSGSGGDNTSGSSSLLSSPLSGIAALDSSSHSGNSPDFPCSRTAPTSGFMSNFPRSAGDPQFSASFPSSHGGRFYTPFSPANQGFVQSPSFTGERYSANQSNTFPAFQPRFGNSFSQSPSGSFFNTAASPASFPPISGFDYSACAAYRPIAASTPARPHPPLFDQSGVFSNNMSSYSSYHGQQAAHPHPPFPRQNY